MKNRDGEILVKRVVWERKNGAEDLGEFSRKVERFWFLEKEKERLEGGEKKEEENTLLKKKR